MAARLALLMTLVFTCSVAALPSDRNDYIAWRARKAFAALTMHGIATRADARAAIDRCPTGDAGHLLDGAQRAKLLDAAAEFIWLQATATAAQYIQWREDNGWTFESRQVQLEWNFADQAYQLATGGPLTESVTSEQVLTALWDHARSIDGGRWRMKGIAGELSASCFAIKRSDADDSSWPGPYPVPLAPGYGNVSGFARHWWRCDRSLETRVNNDESVLDAGIIVIVEMENGTRVPLAMRFIFDGPLNEWRIEGAYLIWHQSPSNKWQTQFMGMVIDW